MFYAQNQFHIGSNIYQYQQISHSLSFKDVSLKVQPGDQKQLQQPMSLEKLSYLKSRSSDIWQPDHNPRSVFISLLTLQVQKPQNHTGQLDPWLPLRLFLNLSLFRLTLMQDFVISIQSLSPGPKCLSFPHDSEEPQGRIAPNQSWFLQQELSPFSGVFSKFLFGSFPILYNNGQETKVYIRDFPGGLVEKTFPLPKQEV